MVSEEQSSSGGMRRTRAQMLRWPSANATGAAAAAAAAAAVAAAACFYTGCFEGGRRV